MQEIGTLAELDVNPGDMVEFFKATKGYERYEAKHRGVAMTVLPSGGVTFTGSDGTRNGFSANTPHTFRIVSRATPVEPASEEITWGEWGDFEPDMWSTYQFQKVNGVEQWRYPVPKQPVVETVTLSGGYFGAYGWRFENGISGWNVTYCITFETKDGEPDWSTLRGEDLS